jgi:hypothetical protein
MDTPIIPQQPAPQTSHTQLYIIVGILVVLALAFFVYKYTPDSANDTPVTTSKPLGLKWVALTAEQLLARQNRISDPDLSKTAAVTKVQAKARETTLADPDLKQTAPLTTEQNQRKQELLKNF